MGIVEVLIVMENWLYLGWIDIVSRFIKVNESKIFIKKKK